MSVCMFRPYEDLKLSIIVQNSHKKSIHSEHISLPSQHMSLIKCALQHVAFLSKFYSLLI